MATNYTLNPQNIKEEQLRLYQGPKQKPKFKVGDKVFVVDKDGKHVDTMKRTVSEFKYIGMGHYTYTLKMWDWATLSRENVEEFRLELVQEEKKEKPTSKPEFRIGDLVWVRGSKGKWVVCRDKTPDGGHRVVCPGSPESVRVVHCRDIFAYHGNDLTIDRAPELGKQVAFFCDVCGCEENPLASAWKRPCVFQHGGLDGRFDIKECGGVYGCFGDHGYTWETCKNGKLWKKKEE